MIVLADVTQDVLAQYQHGYPEQEVTHEELSMYRHRMFYAHNDMI